MHTSMFVSLPVKSFKRSKEFFTKLGYSFDEEFTDDVGGCLVLGDNLFAVVMEEERFKTFISKDISDSSKTTGVITALTVESREEVDRIVDRAVELGAREHGEPEDGFMYTRTFEDLDNHLWEIFYVDHAYVPEKK